jgi:hypothetical protein
MLSSAGLPRLTVKLSDISFLKKISQPTSRREMSYFVGSPSLLLDTRWDTGASAQIRRSYSLQQHLLSLVKKNKIKLSEEESRCLLKQTL